MEKAPKIFLKILAFIAIIIAIMTIKGFAKSIAFIVGFFVEFWFIWVILLLVGILYQLVELNKKK